MENVSSREKHTSFLLVLAIFVVTALGLALSAGLGIFSASPEESSTAEKVIEAAAADAEEDITAKKVEEFAADSPEQMQMSQRAVEASGETSAELKLQEVRDTYLRFEAAQPGVTVHYSVVNQCDSEEPCVNPQDSDEILVTKSWALNANEQVLSEGLARAHAELVMKRIWHKESDAETFLNQILPACEVIQDKELLNAAGVTTIPITYRNASIEGIKDVIVANMVKNTENLIVYPQRFHTAVQVEAATQLAHGQKPNVVIQVSDSSCQ